MMTTGLSKRQTDRLAALAAAWRPHDAPEWHEAGIRAAIADTLHLRPDTDPIRLATALLTLAADPTIRTPKPLGMPGPHWGQPTTERPTRVPPTLAIPARREDQADVNARGIAAARAAIAGAARASEESVDA